MLKLFGTGDARYESIKSCKGDAPEDEYMESDDGDDRSESPIAGVAHSQASFRTSDRSPIDMKLPGPFDHDRPQRTVSREGSLPLRHPAPDLQSLQGAYMGNVTRLEQSAERLSLSSDIGEELRRMKLEQKQSESRSSSRRTTHSGQGIIVPTSSRQYSTGSHTSNSVLGVHSVARSGGLSLSGHIASPVGSIRSPSRSRQSLRRPPVVYGENDAPLSEYEHEELHRNPLTTRRPDTEATKVGNRLQFTSQANLESPSKLRESDSAVRAYTESHDLIQSVVEPPDRPTTAVSADSYQQRMHLFADFDGVHISPNQRSIPYSQDKADTLNRSSRTLLPEQPLDSISSLPPEAPPSVQNMVYYPAPVPKLLNLPQRLSKAPLVSLKDKRRSQMIGAISSASVRNTVVGVPEVVERQGEGYNGRNTNNGIRRSMADLPPQLKADLFFGHRPIPQTIEMKADSAVATLDSILDASVHAPVNAFVDPTIARQISAEIYARSPQRSTEALLLPNSELKNRRSSLVLLKHRQSKATMLGDKPQDTSVDARSTSQHRDWSAQWVEEHTPVNEYERVEMDTCEIPAEVFVGEEDENEAAEEGNEEDLFTEAPNTLLAELQLRKHKQKQRGRTAATAFPNGMHSTLLELDTVAQVQKQSRKQEHVTLAWENAGLQKADDEDVPLGMLFPSRKIMRTNLPGQFNENQPLGLIAKRAFEDNEPLSQRRVRLAGKMVGPRQVSPNKRASTYTLEVPGLTDSNIDQDFPEEEHETLAQRVKRLQDPQGQAQSRPLSGDFLGEVMSSLGGLTEQGDPSKSAMSRTPHPEETLGQRRRRLQAEKEATSRTVSGEDASPSRPSLRTRHSMADILHTRRPGASRSPSSGLHPAKSALGGNRDSQQRPTLGMTDRSFSGNIQMASGLGAPGVIPYKDSSFTAFANPMFLSNNAMDFSGYTGVGANGHQIIPPLRDEQASIDPKQRAMIDRWRQSVM